MGALLLLSIYFIYMSALAAGIAAAGNVSGGIISGALNQKRSQENMRYAYELMNKEYLLQPSYQLQGYKNAGINPFVEGASDFQGGTPATFDSSPISFGQLGSDAVNAYNQSALANADVKLKKSEEESNWVKSEEGRENIALIKAKTRCTEEEANNLALEWHKMQSEIDVNLGTAQKLWSDTLLNYALKGKAESDTSMNQSNIDLNRLKKVYQDLQNQSMSKYLNETLPRQWNNMDKDLEVKESVCVLNAIKAKDVGNAVELGNMSVQVATRTLADNIEAAGYEAKVRLGKALLGMSEVNIDRAINSNPALFNMRVATRLVGMLSSDMKTDIVSNAAKALDTVISGASDVISAGAGAVGAVAAAL